MSFSMQRVADFLWGALRVRVLLKGGSSLATVAGAAYLYHHYSEDGVARAIASCFEQGGLHGWESVYRKDALALVSREPLLAKVRQLLQPDASSNYVAVVGASGTGKSTLLRRAVRKQTGSVYFLVDADSTRFSASLARAVGYYRPVALVDRALGLLRGEARVEPQTALRDEPQATWAQLSPLLLKAGSLYAASHGVPPVLVLDAMDLLAKKNPTFFLDIQAFAKLAADAGALRLVLVFSDGAALPLLLSSSAASRAEVVFEVPELPDGDARAYLEAVYGVPSTRAAELVARVTGGNFPLLQRFGASARDVSDVCDELCDKTRAQLTLLGVSPTHPLLRQLNASGWVAESVAVKLIDEESLRSLLEKNILAAHPNGRYTFQSRHVATCVAAAQTRSWKW